MKLTNKHKLPAPLVKALSNDEYSNNADLSITDLSKSPQQFWLGKRHDDTREEDVSSRAWSMLGNAAHHVAEKAAGDGDLVEYRMYFTLPDGNVISGQADVISRELDEVGDYKVTSKWKIVFGEFSDWFQQNNCYRWLYWKETGHELANGRMYVIVRDWNAKEYQQDLGRNPMDCKYPASPVTTVDVETVGMEEMERFVIDRAAYLMSFKDTADEDLPDCTADERWYRGGAYKVYRKGVKRAVNGGVKDNADDAIAVANDLKEANSNFKFEVKSIPGSSNRCEYCAASHVCLQRKRMEDAEVEVIYEV